MSLKKKQDEHLIPVEVWRIYPYSESSPPQTFLVVLKGEEDRFVPISIGAPEGQYLVMAMQQVSFPRPLTHNLFQDLLEKVKGEVRRLVIHTLKEDIFHAYLLIQTEEDVFYLDCRPSDGMILATLMAIPIFMSPEVMEEAGKELGAMLNIADLGEDVSGAGNGEDVDPSLVEVEVRGRNRSGKGSGRGGRRERDVRAGVAQGATGPAGRRRGVRGSSPAERQDQQDGERRLRFFVSRQEASLEIAPTPGIRAGVFLRQNRRIG